MPLDDDDKKEIAAIVAASLKAHTPENTVTADQVGKIVADQLKGLNLDEKITAAVDAAKPKGSDDDAKPKGEDDSEAAARLKAIEDRQRQIEEREAAAIAKERENALTGELSAALEANGIPRDRHAQAIAFLRTKKSAHSGKNVFDFDESGSPVFRQAGKGYDDTLTISEGIKGWASSDEAKLYKPPADRGGTGTGPGRRGAARGRGKETSVNEILGSLDL